MLRSSQKAFQSFSLFSPQKSYTLSNSDSPSEIQLEQKYGHILAILTGDILKSQNISSLDQLNCQKITDAQLLSIGDNWMNMMLGDGAVHKQIGMSNNQQEIKQAYIEMGKYYFNCPNEWTSNKTSAITMEKFNREIEDNINNILAIQHVNSLKQIDCKKIKIMQFYRVGESRMDMMIGDFFVHAQIDKLVGKNGLRDLEQEHVQSGKYALGC